jgi:hypothetical protein
MIDADAAIESLTEYGNGRAVYISVEEAVRRIEQLPSAQPDIIRCKDCKHWNPQLKTANGNGLGSCDFHNVALVTSEGFCYWAERAEQEKRLPAGIMQAERLLIGERNDKCRQV